MENVDSSMNITHRQSSTVHAAFFWAYASLASLLASESAGFWAGTQLRRPLSCSQRLMVDMLAERFKLSLICRAVMNGAFFAACTISRSFALSVDHCLCPCGRFQRRPSSRNAWQTLFILDRGRFIRLEISRCLISCR